MKINLKNVAFSAIAVICTIVVMNSAAAGGPIGETLKQQVNFADLNLNHPEGIAALYKRVHAAAVRVCEPTERDDMAHSSKLQLCIADATSRAVTDVNNPAFTAYANARNGLGQRSLVAGQP
jgi:UrcA family protein